MTHIHPAAVLDVHATEFRLRPNPEILLEGDLELADNRLDGVEVRRIKIEL